MAKQLSISPGLFIASDYVLKFALLDSTETIALDMSGMSLSWMLKKSISNFDSAKLLEKTVGSGITITGTFNADPSINTQRAEVTVAATDTVAFSPLATAQHEFKRMDTGFETVFTYGTCPLVRGVHRA